MSNLSHAGKLAGNLPGLLLEAEKVAQSFMKGVHGRRRVGTGEAFWQFRPFQQGDASRDIDWRQTAKRDGTKVPGFNSAVEHGGAFVRQTEWEASQTVWLYRDASASMNFKSKKALHSKKDYAEIMLLALGIILLNGGEQVSLLGTDLAPQTGYASIQRVCEMLRAQTHLSELGRPVSARSNVLLISDFYFPVNELAAFCEKLAAQHVKGSLVQVFDPFEQSLPYNGRVKFQDMENASDMLDMPEVAAVRENYEQKFTAHQESIGALARTLGWTFEKFSTDIKPEAALSQLYDRLSVKK
jgi:uncharacterized protein (DUF58 family)